MNSSIIDLSKASDRKEIAVVSESTALISVIERAARDPNIDIDKMERLLAMQKEIFAQQAEAAFNAAMSDCQAQMPQIVPRSPNEQTNSMYAALEEIDRVARPIYTRNGFALSFGTKEGAPEGFYRQTCLATHRSGHSRLYQADLPTDMTGLKGNPNKTGIQGFGSTMSYGQRYQTKLVFNIVIGGEDTDGNGPTLGPGQLEEIRKRMQEVGTNEAQFLEFWRIDALEKMPVFNFPVIMDMLDRKAKRVDPRGDMSNVDVPVRDKHVSAITDIISEYGSDEQLLAEKLQEYVAEALQPFPELWIAVNDKLASDRIVSKANMRKILSLNLRGTRER
jgi:hypothetical protein